MGELIVKQPGVKNFACLPDGVRIVDPSDHRVTLVDAAEWSIFQKVDLDPKGVHCLAFSPNDGCLAVEVQISAYEYGR